LRCDVFEVEPSLPFATKSSRVAVVAVVAFVVIIGRREGIDAETAMPRDGAEMVPA